MLIKVFSYNEIMQNEIESFILNNMNSSLEVMDNDTFEKITKDLKDIKENYLDVGGELFFAYDIDSKCVVGTIAFKFESDLAILKRFYVDENYRNKKIGYMLYYEMEKELRKRKINKIYLTSGKELVAAHRFYEKNGWIKEEDNPGIFVRNGADLLVKDIEGSEKMRKPSDVLKEAEILIEAIPYIKEYVGKIMVIKYGGSAMIDDTKKDNIIKQVALLKMLGIKVVLVHGSGPKIEEKMNIKNKEPRYVNGIRVIDKDTVEEFKTLLIGKINSEIVNLLNMQDCNAIGISGIDSSFIECEKLEDSLEYVGKIKNVKTDLILDLLDKNYVPVISPIGVDSKGNYYKINSDIVASKVAVALHAKKIIFLTNIDGILDKNQNLISLINKDRIDELLQNETIKDGMVHKIKACLDSLAGGVERTHILNGSKKNTILYELLSDDGIGTMII